MVQELRRLAAIVSADVAGYSRLMGRDESGTLATLKAHLRELLDPKIAEHSGRIVKTTGDGLLLEFASVVDAVRCAVEIQRGMAERNAAVPAEKQIQFRIGINVGDIIIDGDDIFGDGVNIAARVQTLAEPGGICVSRVVRDQVLDKLNFVFEDLGPKAVRNIARPVEVFRVNVNRDHVLPNHASRSRWYFPSIGKRRWAAIGGAIVILAALAFTLQHFWGATSATLPPLSVAVMPLAVAGDNAIDIPLAETLRNDLVTHMTAARYGMKVLRADDSASARDVSRRHNVRYVVEGALQREGSGRLVQLRLVDTHNGAQVWGGRYLLNDGTSAAQVSARNRKIFSSVSGALYESEMKRVANEPLDRLQAIELVLRGYYQLSQSGPSSLTEARKLYDAALQKEPNLVAALVGKSVVLDSELDIDPSRDRGQIAREMEELTAKALLLDFNSASVWTMRSVALADGGRWSAAFEAIDNAIQRDPYDPHLYVYKAQWMVFTGRPAEALKLVDRAMALEPDYIGWAMMVACEAHLFLGEPEQAIAKGERAAPSEPNRSLQLYLAAAYGNHGELEKALAARQLALEKMPVRTIAQLRAMRVSDDPAYLKLAETYLYPGLVKSGMAER